MFRSRSTPRRRAARAAALLLACALPACTVGPDYVAPELALPAQWPEPLSGGETIGAGALDGAPAPGGEVSAEAAAAQAAADAAALAGLPHWWTAFGDEQLDALVTVAVRDNLDLQRAGTRILEARALRTLAGAPAEPQVNAAGGVDRSERSDNAGASSFAPGQTQTLYDVGFDALWELDLFGGTRRAVEAANADLASAESFRDFVLVSLVAEVARDYLELRSTQWRLQIARDNLAAQEDTLGLTRSRQQAGLGTELDVARAEAQSATTRAQIPALQSREAAALHQLDVLLGRPAGAGADALLPGASDGVSHVPPPPPRVPVGLPSELLRRRPDIAAAEATYAAANARIGQATADLWPKFSLTGSLGLSSESTGNLFKTDSRYWSLGGGLTWPVLDGGAIRATIAIADARTQDALLAWRQTVLQAFAEVADALVAFGREQERRQTLLQAAEAQRRAVVLATDLHAAGLAEFLDVLVAQNQRLLAEDQLALSEQELSQQYVALCKALGGGWDPEAPATPVAAAP